MYARVTTVQIQPGKQDELLTLLRDTVVPMAQHQPGFRGIFLMSDPRTGKGMSVSLWETEADLINGETSGYLQEVRAQTSAFYVMPPFREVYEVTLQVAADGTVLAEHLTS